MGQVCEEDEEDVELDLYLTGRDSPRADGMLELKTVHLDSEPDYPI